MICITKGNSIIFGPAPWDFNIVLEHLIVAGFDLLEGVLYRHGEAPGEMIPVCAFPATPPPGPITLPGGMRILPVVDVDEPAPAGQVLVGRILVVVGDQVERRPDWGDAPTPPQPPQPQTRAAAYALKGEEITRGAQAVLAPYRGEYCDEEMASWEQQAAQAGMLTSNPALAAPPETEEAQKADPLKLLRRIATRRGMDIMTLAGRILANKPAWEILLG